MGTLPKRTNLPLYYQIEQVLRERIMDGTFKEGSMIPPESQLEKEFQVSRITVRRAVENLVQLGLLRKQQGIGTTVTKSYIDDDINSLEGFTEKMERQGHRVSSTLLEAHYVVPSEPISVCLGLPAGTKVLLISRVRNVDGAPLALFNTYIPPNLGITDKEDFSGSLFEVYERHGIVPTYSDRTIRAINVCKRTAELLQINVNDAALQLNYEVFDGDGRPIEYDEGIYRGDWYQYKMRIYRTMRRV
ncbi:MAG: GntR family transcriptional regulator [Sphaerochaetaceae bacterium]|jgi:GntR family transcriptional regulator|nr:GntR family transcriptional regulator [Sphaerochaetaceae bacterium]MDX9939130.1 GntR family transcriptional regulator [Sphaerochaetaceae bacterium]